MILEDLTEQIMLEITKILREIADAEEKQEAQEKLEAITYHDQPILQRASRISPPAQKNPPDDQERSLDDDRDDFPEAKPAKPHYPERTPDIYQRMYAIAASETSYYFHSDRFYKEALLMENYVDSFPLSRTHYHYYVKQYETLNIKELRGYFTWRDSYRRGVSEDDPPDYLMLHVFELLHNIGAKDARDAHDQLKKALERIPEYGQVDEWEKQIWLRDHAIYNELKDCADLIDEDQLAFDQCLEAIFHRKETEKSSFLENLTKLSSYKLTRSPFYRTYPELTAQILWTFYESLEQYYSKHRKYSLEESLYGFPGKERGMLFPNATFYDFRDHREIQIQMSALTTYECQGTWLTITRYHGRLGKNAQIGVLLKALDRILREEFNFRSKLKDDRRCPKYVQDMLRKIIRTYIRDQEEKERKRQLKKEEEEKNAIHFDLSSLDQIRTASMRTQESLLAGTDEIPEEELLQSEEARQPVPEEEERNHFLSDEEQTYLELLMDHRDPVPFLQQHHLIESILVDQINDHLLEVIGDTVIEMADTHAEIIEDYIDTLKGLL